MKVFGQFTDAEPGNAPRGFYVPVVFDQMLLTDTRTRDGRKVHGDGFEPFDLPGGRTAYLAIWEVGSGMTDLTAIVPLKGRALLVTLKSAQQLDAFQRLLRSIELVDG